MKVHCFSIREGILSLKRLLPGMHGRHLFQLRLRRYINEDGLSTRQRIGDGGYQLIWMADPYTMYAKCLSNTNSVHVAGEIDTEVALAVVQPLKHLDPPKGAVIEHDDGNGQVQAESRLRKPKTTTKKQ